MRKIDLYVGSLVLSCLALAQYQLAHACADPQTHYMYDATLTGIPVKSTKVDTTAYLRSVYPNKRIIKAKNKAIQAEFMHESNRLKIDLKNNICDTGSCTLSIYSINTYAFIEQQENVFYRNEAKVMEIQYTPQLASPIVMSINRPRGSNTILVVVDRHKTGTQNEVIAYEFKFHQYCTYTIYTSTPEMAGYLNYCVTYTGGGFYYDPWPKTVERDSVCPKPYY